MKFFTGTLCAIAIAVIILGVSGAVSRNPGEPLTITGETNRALGSHPWTMLPTNSIKDLFWGESPSITVRWQWDDIRRENKLAQDQYEALTEFQKTNTNPNAGFILQTYWPVAIPSSTNDVELGFRSDGMVVWRVPPEAKP